MENLHQAFQNYCNMFHVNFIQYKYHLTTTTLLSSVPATSRNLFIYLRQKPRIGHWHAHDSEQ